MRMTGGKTQPQYGQPAGYGQPPAGYGQPQEGYGAAYGQSAAPPAYGSQPCGANPYGPISACYGPPPAASQGYDAPPASKGCGSGYSAPPASQGYNSGYGAPSYGAGGYGGNGHSQQYPPQQQFGAAPPPGTDPTVTSMFQRADVDRMTGGKTQPQSGQPAGYGQPPAGYGQSAAPPAYGSQPGRESPYGPVRTCYGGPPAASQGYGTLPASKGCGSGHGAPPASQGYNSGYGAPSYGAGGYGGYGQSQQYPPQQQFGAASPPGTGPTVTSIFQQADVDRMTGGKTQPQYGQPAGYGQPPAGYGQSAAPPAYGSQPGRDYGPVPTCYGAPPAAAQGYGAPPASKGCGSGYGAPPASQGYNSGYGAPSYGAGGYGGNGQSQQYPPQQQFDAASPPGTDPTVTSMFQQADVDRSGTIDAYELGRVLSQGRSPEGVLKLLSVSSPSCAGENGTGSCVQCSSDFRCRLNNGNPEHLMVRLSKASIKAIPLNSIPFFKHRFVELKVYSPLLRDNFYVTAELNRDRANGKINVRVNLREKHAVDIEIEVELYEENVLLSEVIAILLNHSSDYNIVRDNCYQYADNIFRDVVKRFGIDVAPSKKIKATLQKRLDNHRRPVLPTDVLKKRYAAGAAVGTGVATAAVAKLAVECWPITVGALFVAPKALFLTAGAMISSPAFWMGGYAMNKLRRCVKGALVPSGASLRAITR